MSSRSYEPFIVIKRKFLMVRETSCPKTLHLPSVSYWLCLDVLTPQDDYFNNHCCYIYLFVPHSLQILTKKHYFCLRHFVSSMHLLLVQQCTKSKISLIVTKFLFMFLKHKKVNSHRTAIFENVI